MKVPFVDLGAQHEALAVEMQGAWDRITRGSDFIGGEEHDSFEKEFASYCQAPACAGVGNGTDALYLTLRAAGLGTGDEVITVANTFIATVEAITMTGATPVFVDVSARDHQIDPVAVEAAITERTKVILPVHLYGIPAPVDQLMEIANRRGLLVVEDAAQAHGAALHSIRTGSLGHAASFSFYPSKNLGAYGDAGAVVSRDTELVERVRMLSHHGRREKYLHEIPGVNSRIDNLQAAILRIKLRHLDAWNAQRRTVAARYVERLAGSEVIAADPGAGADPVWHLFVIRAKDRDGLRDRLKNAGVATGVHYPVPLHLQPALSYLGLRPGSLPVTEALASEILSLPMYPHMQPDQVDYVSERVHAAA